jgi:hypothetical protein
VQGRKGSYADFWRLFEERAGELAAAASADAPVHDALLARLHAIDPGLYLEFSAGELIVTADGDRALFPLARAVVEAAPAVEGWTIRALKPKLGFPEEVRWYDLRLRTADLVFDPLTREGSSDLGLLILVPGIGEDEVEDAHSAILRALDHALGEEGFAESVQHVEVRPLPEATPPDEFIPLAKLEDFLRWRAARRGGA